MWSFSRFYSWLTVFIIYVNKTHVNLYADVTNLFYSHPDVASLIDTVQSEFVKIHNVKKTTSVFFRSHNKLVDQSIQCINSVVQKYCYMLLLVPGSLY